MTLEQIGIIILSVGVLAAFGLMFVGYLQLKSSRTDKHDDYLQRFSKLESRVEILWLFIMRRSLSESITDNMGTLNSPFVPNEKCYGWFTSLKDDLKAFYNYNKSLSDFDLIIAIEDKFGDRILRDVCVPNKLTSGVCLLIAASVAKGQKPVEIGSTFAKPH